MTARVVVAAALSAAWLAAPGDVLAASRAAIVALVWSVAVGLPRAARAHGHGRAPEDASRIAPEASPGGRRTGRPLARAAFAAGAAAPFLGLALALERAGGAAALEPPALVARGLAALALAALAALAAERARGGAVHALLWTALVAGLPACAALLAWTTGGVAPALAVAATWSPLGWLLAWAAGAPAPPWGALATSLALASLAPRRSAEGPRDGEVGGPRTASLAGCVVTLVAAPATAPFEVGRAALVEVALSGPLDACELVTEHGTTRVAASLAAGETRRALVPIAGSAVARDPRLVLVTDAGHAGGDARVVGVREPVELRTASLARRTLPPIADPDGGADPAALAALAAAALVTVGLRRRPVAVLAAGLAGGTLLFAFGAAGRAPPRTVTVHEGAGDAWLAVIVARDALVLEPAPDLLLAVDPPTAVLGFAVELGPPERWTALAPGARLVRRAAWSPPDGRWRGAGPGTDLGPGLGAVLRGWRRSGDGAWLALAPDGGTGAGGGAGTGDEVPPGWLAAFLPQGVDALVLELPPDPATGGERWLRWVGSLENR